MQRLILAPLSLSLLVACGDQKPLPQGSQITGTGAAPTTGGSTASGGTGGVGVGTGGGSSGGATGGISSLGGTSGSGGLTTTGATGGQSTGGTGGPTGGTGGVAGGSGGIATGGIATGGLGGQNTGGASGGTGTGGAPVSPYGNGVVPATITTADARAAYDEWKAIHLEDCGGGVQRVRWENAKLDATVSEGIGYGMLLAVSWNEQTVFDGLFAYSKLMRGTGSSLMNWLRYGCSASWATTYSEYPDGAASDADLDVAMSLIMAACRWGNSSYATEATTIVNAIRSQMFIDDAGLRVLQPGDSLWFDELGAGCVNYSYFAPAYYRAFAELVPADAAFWNGAAADAYTLLGKASHASTGLVRNWGSAGGGDATGDCSAAYNRASSYGDDAARTPWRIATDYLWFGTAAAKSWNDKVTSWVKPLPISTTGQWYNLDGTLDTAASGYADHTVINVGPFAVGSMTADQSTVDAFAAEILAIPTTTGSHDAEYFSRMLRALSLLTLSGGFTRCGGS